MNTVVKSCGSHSSSPSVTARCGNGLNSSPKRVHISKTLSCGTRRSGLDTGNGKAQNPDKAGDYEIMQSIRMGGRVLLMGFNPKDETYMTCYQQYNFLGETMYPEALACKSYLEIAETFLNRLQAQVEKVKAFRVSRNVPYAVLGVDDCLPPSEGSLQGKLIVLRPTSLSPEYRTADCQLGFALGGFGCTPGARGRAVYFEELYSGERCRWDITDVLGVADTKRLPEWAKQNWQNTKRSAPRRKKKR